jgi:predicted N-formylglutamate amidohydrolase
MSEPDIIEGRDPRILLICDHASAVVPDGIDLGIAPDLLNKHIAIDIGAGPLTRALAQQLDAPVVLATVSRLVIDLHRQPDHPGLIPESSDGHLIPGNVGADRHERIAAFHAPYHRTLAAEIARHRPKLIASTHSFTPCLEDGGTPRPWQVGILSNRDRRAADLAVAALEARGIVTGDNEPYSGRLLNATLNRHAEAQGIPSIAIEVRNDLIADDAGVAHWRDILGQILIDIRNSLAQGRPVAP